MMRSSEDGRRPDSDRPVVLIPFQLYIPGDEGGGPIRSMSNLVERLSDTFDFKVLTSSDNFAGSEMPEAVARGEWVEVGEADVRYLRRSERSFVDVARQLWSIDCDAIYLNGFFPTRFTLPVLLFNQLGLLPDTPVVLVPRGQFYEGALSQKSWKKRPYIEVVRRMGLYDDIVWQATNEDEKEQIETYFGEEATIQQAPNLGTIPDVKPGEDWSWATTEPGVLRAVFLSRISPKKNLPFALDCLARVEGEVQFDIYGPIWSDDYWRECQERIEELPENINVEYHGAVDHEEVFEIFGAHDLFWFPTLGENFGHVIFESLISGCPVLVSDETPWTNLAENGVGWSYPLDEEMSFVDQLQWCIDADESAYRPLREAAHSYALKQGKQGEGVAQSRRLFERALAG